MEGVAGADLDRQQRLAVELKAEGVDFDGRLDRVRAHTDYELLHGVQLAARHPLNFTVIGDAAEQYAAVAVGECRQFIRQPVAMRSDRAVAAEFDLFELPAAVLTQPELAPNGVVVEISCAVFEARGCARSCSISFHHSFGNRGACLAPPGSSAQAAQPADSTSACSNTVRVARSCLSGG